MKLSIVIPLYNSELTIKKVIDEINQCVPAIAQVDDYEIILVNDCSPDNVMGVCRELSSHQENLKVINLSKNFGQHNAMMAGFNNVTGDIIISMDDDFQTPGNEINKLVDTLINGKYDLVFAKYNDYQQNKFRALGSGINDYMAVKLTNKPKGLRMTSFYAVRRFIIDEIIKYDFQYTYLSGLYFRTTQNIGTVDITHRSREEGTSNYNLLKLVKLWFDGFTSFSVAPLRFASLLGFITAIFGFLFIVIILIKSLVFKVNFFTGWPSIMIIVTFFSGVQLLSIGLLGEYVGRIFVSQNKAPQFVVKEKLNFDNKKHEYEKN